MHALPASPTNRPVLRAFLAEAGGTAASSGACIRASTWGALRARSCLFLLRAVSLRGAGTRAGRAVSLPGTLAQRRCRGSRAAGMEAAMRSALARHCPLAPGAAGLPGPCARPGQPTAPPRAVAPREGLLQRQRGSCGAKNQTKGARSARRGLGARAAAPTGSSSEGAGDEQGAARASGSGAEHAGEGANGAHAKEGGGHEPHSATAAVEQARDGGAEAVALLLEVEGVMLDVHRGAHLEAFRAAFLACGFDAAKWSTSTYNSLHRRTGGDPLAMLRVLFDLNRWPMDGLDAGGKEALLARLLQLKGEAFQHIVDARQVALRPGVLDLLEEALAAGAGIAAIVSQARCGEDTARTLLLGALPPRLQDKVVVVGRKEAQASLFGQVTGAQATGGDPREGTDDALAAQLTEAVALRKQMVAEEVARVLRVRAELDTASAGARGAEGVAALRAACELLEVPLGRVAVLAGSQGMVQVATRAGLPSVAVRSSITAQAEFPGAVQVYEDFGPGSLTLPRLLRRLGLSS